MRDSFSFTEDYHFSLGWEETETTFIWPVMDENEGFLEKSVRRIVIAWFDAYTRVVHGESGNVFSNLINCQQE